MTAISLINPYAPQPAGFSPTENGLAPVQKTQPATDPQSSNDTGQSSGQSGQGAGNSTGTGGALLGVMLKNGRETLTTQRPTPKSVVEAQSEGDPATEYLARQAQLKAEAQAAAAARTADRMAQDAVQAKQDAAEAAEPDFEMPNPLPTAPILQDKEG